jgi:integrase
MATITKVKDRAKPWRVQWRADGERHLRHFETKPEAAAFARDLATDLAAPDLAVTVDERVAVTILRPVAEKAGLTVLELAKKLIGSGPASVRDVAVEQSVKDYLADARRRNLRPATIRNYEWELERFQKGRESRLVSTLAPDEIAAYISRVATATVTRQTTRTIIQGWLRWAARDGQADVGLWSAPVRIESRMEDRASVSILRPAQARIILNRLPTNLQLAFALCCLTGIRPKGELTRLNWDMIDTRNRQIVLPGAATKTRQPRTLHDLPPAVWDWIAARRSTGRVLPITYDAFRSALGAVSPWELAQDCTRHSFASYGYHALGIERTVELMGHVAGFKLFAGRYKATARATMARLWFSMKPRKARPAPQTHENRDQTGL